MKLIIAIAILCLAALSQAGNDMKEFKLNMIRGMSKECASKVGASPADIDAMADNKEEMTREGKCLQACLMKQLDVMTSGGEINLPGFRKLAMILTENNEAKVNKAEQHAKECQKTKSGRDDECEAAYKYSQCMLKQVI